jgi:cellulose synthase/poly-beta-1,6-N-acetylglucosamine synthase-like glycosyltransferase
MIPGLPDAGDPQAWIGAIAWAVAALVIASCALQVVLYTAHLVIAAVHMARRGRTPAAARLWSDLAEVAPPIALLVPAYNEEATIIENIRSLLSLDYPTLEVIVVNDGSRDATLARVIETFGLVPVERAFEASVPHRPLRGLYASRDYPNLLMADKENGGKSDALNAGINLSRAPLFCAVDADSVLETDALIRAVGPFIEDPEGTAVIGGTIRVANGCRIEGGRVVEAGLPRRILPLFQTVEYLRAFLMARIGWSRMGALTIVSGAFGIFRRTVAVAVGGYTQGTVGEDIEIVIKIHRHMIDAQRPYRIVFSPEPACWTEAPETLAVLARQRRRWQRGTLETFARHRDMLFDRRYGRIGTLGFGSILLIDVLGPPLEVAGYVLIPWFWWIGALSLDALLAFLGLTFGFGVFLSVGAVLLEELGLRRFPRTGDLARLTLAAVLENFGYRQLNNLWRIQGTWEYLRGVGGWGEMTRRGIGAPKPGG